MDKNRTFRCATMSMIVLVSLIVSAFMSRSVFMIHVVARVADYIYVFIHVCVRVCTCVHAHLCACACVCVHVRTSVRVICEHMEG